MKMEPQETLEYITLKIGEAEIAAAHAGLHLTQAEKNVIWERMIRDTMHLRKCRDKIIELMATLEAYRSPNMLLPRG